MDQESKPRKLLIRILSYVLVSVITCVVTLSVALPRGGAPLSAGRSGKLEELKAIINAYFIGEVDGTYLEDMAADAMVTATGDRWSYYIPASEKQSYEDNKNNAYVGIGVTIQVREDEAGFDVLRVEPGGSALEAGILAGDILTEVDGHKVGPLGTSGAKELIQGNVGTTVNIAVLRDGERLEFTLTRKRIQQAVAFGQLLEGNVGYIRIVNFNDRCAEETISLIEDLREQGATKLLFDVRFNPGGYKHELVKLLDYLLPEGDLFRSLDYTGKSFVDTSDSRCLDMPMAVLINSESYSAAEFFAAALKEYDYAFTAGEPTTGKGNYQSTFTLSDGSAVALSIGKYFTPKGVSLAEAGGLIPDVQTPIDEDMEAQIYSQLLPPQEDPQVQAALEKLVNENN